MERNRKQALALSWLFVGTLVVLSLALGFLQYRWIGEVSRAERDRLQGSLQTSLNRLRTDFNSELTAACAALLPDRGAGEADREREYAERYSQWRDLARHHPMFKSISRVVPRGRDVRLRALDMESLEFHDTPWPAKWQDLQESFAARLTPSGPGERRPFPRFATEDHPELIQLSAFNRGPRPGPPTPAEMEWLIVELDLDYLRSALLPELLQRHLGTGGTVEYAARITPRDQPDHPIYEAGWEGGAAARADASVRLFDVRPDPPFRRPAFFQSPDSPRVRPRGWRLENRGGMAAGEPGPLSDRGKWLLSVRNKAGSLDAVVERMRWRNLAVTAGVLLLMLGAVAALVRYTRRAQSLAELQMEFVAGVSHELRTPLTVMRTAGHNLQGKVSNDPAKVQRYGALIAGESDKLTGIVEQVLSFSNARAGRLVAAEEPVEVAALVEDVINASRHEMEASHCVIEKNVQAQLPPLMGDSNALKHALQNLVSNAAKYGKDGNWIGLTALAASEGSAPVVEIRVADHGPGIPRDEMSRIFEPFYRGRRAISDQIHGTGLGLSLARRIIEAHRGTIRVRTEEGRGAEFIVRIPAAPQPQTT